jgi:hypothetical protein
LRRCRTTAGIFMVVVEKVKNEEEKENENEKK